MNQENLDNYSPKKKRILKQKLNHWSRFRYLTLTAFILSITLAFFSSAWLPIGQSFGYTPQNTTQEFIIAQEEESESGEAAEAEAASESEEAAEAEAASESEETAEAEAEAESGETAEEEEEESGETAEAEAASESEEAAEAEEEEESGEAAEAEEEEESGEAAEAEEEESGEEMSFEEEKESLEEAIDERYEEWESAKKSNEFSHSFSAISTIVMTVIIVFLGMEILQPPYRRTAILVIGIITVLIQLNNNLFLLEKSLVGYDILKEQSLILKNKLEKVETEEELKEIREQFQELKLEAIEIE